MNANNPLETQIQFAKGIGPARAKLLNKLDLFTVNDMFWHLPTRYVDRRVVKDAVDMGIGREATFRGKIESHEIKDSFKGMKSSRMVLQDRTGKFICQWTHKSPKYMQETYPVGSFAVGYGSIEHTFNDMPLVVPEDMSPLRTKQEMSDFAQITPIYPLTEGVKQRDMQRMMRRVVKDYQSYITETLPDHIRGVGRTDGFVPLEVALPNIHFPLEIDNIDRLNSQKSSYHLRLIFEEFFFLELGIAVIKRKQKSKRQIAYHDKNNLGSDLYKKIDFELTKDQKSALTSILNDMRRDVSMNRLLQGDVGSGKTIVALMAMLLVVSNGHQAALMAPTEVLAEQHSKTISRFLSLIGLESIILTGDVKGKQRKEVLGKIESGEAKIIVGTHALLFDKVDFNSLGMIVIDEQHRFGVVQREMIKEKGLNPDMLIMTATPIPRTLALTTYGNLDVSTIKTMPSGRKPIETQIIKYKDKNKAYDVVRNEVENGSQAFIVYPLIEESESLDLDAAVTMHGYLRDQVFVGLTVGLIHGKMASDEKNFIMQEFSYGNIDVLVSTTVIEVGIDIPNATVMVVENAERFGLAQLHQLRGRVGRGEKKGICILIPGNDAGKDGYRRCAIMEENSDGFTVSEHDLLMRGHGEILGTKQSGWPEMKIANLSDPFHALFLDVARKEAFDLIGDGDGPIHENSPVMQVLVNKWGDKLKFLETF